MKKKIKSALFIMLVSVVTFVACNKDEVKTATVKKNETSDIFIPTNKIEVINGMLVFESKMAYDVTKLEISNANRHSVDLWENKLGIKTQANIFNKVILSEDSISHYYKSLPVSEQEYWFSQPQIHSEKYLNALNSEIIHIVTDNSGNKYFDLNLYDNSASNLINIEGFVKIGDQIHQYTKDAIKIIKDGDFNKIETLKNINKTYQKDNIIVTVFDDERIKNIKGVNGHNWTQFPIDWFYLDFNWRNKPQKRVKVWIDGHSESYGSGYGTDCTEFLNCTFIIRAEAQNKNFWGNWVYTGDYVPSFSMSASWSYEYRDYSYDTGITYGCGLYDVVKRNDLPAYSCSGNPSYMCPTSPHSYSAPSVNNLYHSLTPHGVWSSSPKFFSDAFTVNGTLTAYIDGIRFAYTW